MLSVLDDEVARFKASPEGEGFWGLTTIWTTMRGLDTRGVVESMDHCITSNMEFPHLIAGYDLVGPEDPGRPLVDLLPELFWFRKQCEQEGVNIPFFFHAGETLGDGSAADANLLDAVLLGTRRIGHAFSLYKHPLLVDMVKERRILVESCPVSNEVLRLCGSIMSHLLPALLARGVACSLSNDDPAEWADGVRAASLGAGLKARRLRQWRVEWERFCLWVVDEAGDELGGGPDGADEAPPAAAEP